MLHMLVKPPERVIVALSGGVDSMVTLDFLRRGRRRVEAAYYHHGTTHGEQAYKFVTGYCLNHNIPLHTQHICNFRDQKPNETQEQYWRNARYSFLDTLPNTVVTAHHLDDQVESYLFGCFTGRNHMIPIQRGKYMRPFLTTPKKNFINWATRHNVPWIEDQSNTSLCHTRNRIRHNILPEVLEFSPGIYKIVKKLTLVTHDS